MACFEGERRSDVYSSLLRFFPRFSGDDSFFVGDDSFLFHKRRGSPNSVPEEETNRSGSPVRSIDSISPSGGVSKLRPVRSGVFWGRVLLNEDCGGTLWDSVLPMFRSAFLKIFQSSSLLPTFGHGFCRGLFFRSRGCFVLRPCIWPTDQSRLSRRLGRSD